MLYIITLLGNLFRALIIQNNKRASKLNPRIILISKFSNSAENKIK